MRPVCVVGGGLAGAMLATYLGRRGHPVTVFEARRDLRIADIDAGKSINLALATRGMAALDELGLMAEVEPLLTPMRGRMVHADDRKASLQPYGIREHEVIHSVSRPGLNAVLLDAAEATGNVEVRFQHRCVGGDLPSRTLRFEHVDSGDEIDFASTAFFGADGFGSTVRKMILPLSGGTLDVDPLDHGYKELTLPAADDGSPRLDPNALHIWPRGESMLIALPNIDSSFTCTLFIAEQGEPYSLQSLRTPQRVRSFFEAEFPEFASLMPGLEAEYLQNPDGRLATLRCSGWQYEDAAVILGDAAHAIVPFHGQGMNAAFESCSVLMSALTFHGDDWAEAFLQFEALRKPDVDAIADMALDNYIEMRSGVVDDRYVLQRELALDLERRWPDRFIPRYSMVMFSTMPYAEAQRRARLQAAILQQLTAGVSTVDDVDLERAEELVMGLPE